MNSIRPCIAFDRATSGDVDEIVELVQSAYRGDPSRRGWTTEADLLDGQRVDSLMVSESLAGEDSLILTGRLERLLVACCELQRRGDEQVHLGMFAVDPECQGRGIGRMVLAEAEQVAVARWGAERMTLTVIDARSELIAWYERHGYLRTGEIIDFPYGDERFGVPLRPDLQFVGLTKTI